jgi:hypothetical protein
LEVEGRRIAIPIDCILLRAPPAKSDRDVFFPAYCMH